jgi:hypothetical protein
VFFTQRRVGHGGRSFVMTKFRSMTVGADQVLPEGNDADGPLFKLRDDPRVTRIGRFLRRSSLDELPQLLNVLRGEMSLVGPRPPLESEVAAYEEDVHVGCSSSRAHRALAGERSQRPVVGGQRPIGPLLRGELVVHVRPAHPHAHAARHAREQRRLLTQPVIPAQVLRNASTWARNAATNTSAEKSAAWARIASADQVCRSPASTASATAAGVGSGKNNPLTPGATVSR